MRLSSPCVSFPFFVFLNFYLLSFLSLSFPHLCFHFLIPSSLSSLSFLSFPFLSVSFSSSLLSHPSVFFPFLAFLFSVLPISLLCFSLVFFSPLSSPTLPFPLQHLWLLCSRLAPLFSLLQQRLVGLGQVLEDRLFIYGPGHSAAQCRNICLVNFLTGQAKMSEWLTRRNKMKGTGSAHVD